MDSLLVVTLQGQQRMFSQNKSPSHSLVGQSDESASFWDLYLFAKFYRLRVKEVRRGGPFAEHVIRNYLTESVLKEETCQMFAARQHD